MKFAWIENDRIRDISTGNPAERYHPDVAVHYSTGVPDEAENGDWWVEGRLVKPEPPVPVEFPSPVHTFPKVSPVEFKLLFTAQERVGIKASRGSDPVIDDFMGIIEDPRLTVVDLGLGSTQDGLAYIVSKGLLTEERKAEVLQGVMK